MFRRPRRPIPPRFIADNPATDEIARANQLLAAGQPAEAAVMFIKLARQMQAMGHPRQAANLHAQAAHAWLDAGVEERAMNQAGMAMQIFARQGMIDRAHEFKTNFMKHLKERGLDTSAETVGRTYAAVEAVVSPRPEQKTRRTLPTVCPHCGAPVRSDAVDWIDDASAECGFCSGVIPGI